MERKNVATFVVVVGSLLVGAGLIYGLYFAGDLGGDAPMPSEPAVPTTPPRVVRSDGLRVNPQSKLNPRAGRPSVSIDPRAAAAAADTDADDLVAPAPADEPWAFEPGVYAMGPAGIRHAVEERKVELQACYETHLHHTPDLAGRVILDLVVEPTDGAYSGVSGVDVIASDLEAPFLEGCIATVFEELRFEPVDAPVTISYPVVFTVDEPE